MNSDSGAAAPLEKTSSRPRKQVNNQIDMYIHFFGGIYPAGVFFSSRSNVVILKRITNDLGDKLLRGCQNS